MQRRYTRFLRSLHRPIMASALLAGGAALLLLPVSAIAQQAATRVVQGKVEHNDGSMAEGAIVYIKNAKSLEVRTYISTADGSYRFGQLNPDANYTVWAELKGHKSKEKSISAFDSKKVFDIALKLED